MPGMPGTLNIRSSQGISCVWVWWGPPDSSRPSRPETGMVGLLVILARGQGGRAGPGRGASAVSILW